MLKNSQPGRYKPPLGDSTGQIPQSLEVNEKNFSHVVSYGYHARCRRIAGFEDHLVIPAALPCRKRWHPVIEWPLAWSG